MRLAVGTRLGPYEVLAPLGAGGMGEVYRARDTRLGREVALKLIPPEHFGDDVARARFHQEARTLSSLSHPNIASLFEFDSEQGTEFLVMELVSGTSLRAKVTAGPLTMKEFFPLAIQMAQGLEAAHAVGIVHRDLKPENLMVTPRGHLKILDFGLAKFTAAAHVGAATASYVTEAGGAPGTIPYMAPEQLRGEPADSRIDLYAAGAVLYEMATGRRVFEESGAVLVDAILNREPVPPSAVNPRIPSPLNEAILKALDKEPNRRYQSARELAIDLERAADAVTRRTTHYRPPPLARWRSVLLPAAAVAILITGIWLGTLRESVGSGRTSFGVDATIVQLTSYAGSETSGALSPDGKFFAFVAEKSGASDLWVRQVSGGEPVQLTHDRAPKGDVVYTSDGQSMYFFSQGAIWRIPALGGNPRKVVPGARSPSPSRDGTQLAYVRVLDKELGGQPQWVAPSAIEIANADGTAPRKIYQAAALQQVSWSPDGAWLAFTKGDLFDTVNLYVIDPQGQRKRQVTQFGYGSVNSMSWFPDSHRLVISRAFEANPIGSFDLAIVAIDGGPLRRLTLNAAVQLLLPSLSADGTKLLATSLATEREVWKVPLGSDPASNGAKATRLLDKSWDPMWTHVSHDGSALLFNSSAAGSRNLWSLPLNGATPPRQITTVPRSVLTHSSLSPDGSQVAYVSLQSGNAKIWIMNTDGSGATQLTSGPGQDFWPSWSPDSRWIAFGSTRGGHPAIWKVPAGGGPPVLVSSNGARIDFSPVDNRIAYTDWLRWHIGIVDSETKKVSLDLPMADFPTLPVWSPDGRYLSVVRNDTQDADAIWIVDAQTGQSRLAAKLPPPFHMIFRAGWADHGKSVIVNRTENISHIVLLENF
jgi:Tol biopolymer transport system component